MEGRAVTKNNIGAVFKFGDGHGHIPHREHAVGHRLPRRSAASLHQARDPVTDFRRSREAIRDPGRDRWRTFAIYRNPPGILIANPLARISRPPFQKSRTSWSS